jgi:glycosyltransferase involved in cell wall biosynthesis
MEATTDVTAIITAMTDGERPFLGACLESVISDPGIGHVIVCVQESNSWIDGILAAIRRDSLLQVLRLPLASPGVVRNEAVKHVQTDWLAFCDGDDVWCKSKTLIQRACALENKCDFVGTDHYLIDEDGHTRAVALAKYLPMTSSWMMRTSVMRDHPFKDVIWEDDEWWKRTVRSVPKCRCPRLLIRYRVRAGSLSTSEPSRKRKARAVAMASIPVIGGGVMILTACAWLLNRRKYYCPLLK